MYGSWTENVDIVKKIDSQIVTTQMDDFERRLCAHTQAQINLKKFLRNTTFLVQLPYIPGHSLTFVDTLNCPG